MPDLRPMYMQTSMLDRGKCHIEFWKFTQGKEEEALKGGRKTVKSDWNALKGNRKMLKGDGVALKGDEWRSVTGEGGGVLKCYEKTYMRIGNY